MDDYVIEDAAELQFGQHLSGEGMQTVTCDEIYYLLSQQKKKGQLGAE